MGWKNVKEHYRVTHIVQVTEKGICIGSGYVHDLIVIDHEGEIKKRYGYDRLESNKDLLRYLSEMDSDPALLRTLVQSPDSFAQAIPVYTYEDAAVLEKRCEQLGWPNVTHDGCLMYENTFSPDKAQVVQWAKRNIDAGIRLAKRGIQQLETDLAAARAELAQYESSRAQLEADYPGGADHEGCAAAAEACGERAS